MNLSDIKNLYRKPTTIEVEPITISTVSEGGDPISTPTQLVGGAPKVSHCYILSDEIYKSLKNQSLGMGQDETKYIDDFITDAINYQLQGWSARR